jgi:hypothetical protein
MPLCWVMLGADIEVRAKLRRGGSLPEEMVVFFLTRATVDRVVVRGIRGGASSRGHARARWRRCPGASPSSGEAEMVSEGKPGVGRGEVLRPWPGLFFYHIKCPVQRW